MNNDELIAVNDFCTTNNVETSFLYSLSESGLVQLTTIEESAFISVDQLPGLEKWVRLHYEMDINLEGIEAIQHLLQQMKDMQHEMDLLKQRLAAYGW